MREVRYHALTYRTPGDPRTRPLVLLTVGDDGPLPVTVQLHDGLPEPTEGAFHDWAARVANRCREMDLPDLALVLPLVDGNAGWLLAADVLDAAVRAAAAHPLVATGPYALLGSGAGATGALTLAWHWPARYRRVIACDPWPGFGGDSEGPDWQRPQRQAAGWFGAADIAEAEPAVRIVHRGDGGPLSEDYRGSTRPAPAPAAAWTAAGAVPWTYLLPWGRVLEPASYGEDFVVVAKRKDEAWRLASSEVARLELAVPADLPAALDGQPLPAGPVVCERAGDRWLFTSAAEALPPRFKRPGRAGPVGEIHRGPLALVHGTLGDDDVRIAQKRLAKAWAAGIAEGHDSLNLHPGDRRPLHPPLVRDDRHVRGHPDEARHLVCVGTPRDHLLLAQWEEDLAIEWSEDAVVCGDVQLTAPADALIILQPRPEHEDGCVLVVTALTPAGYDGLEKLPTAWMPDWLLVRAGRVADWGHCQLDWRP